MRLCVVFVDGRDAAAAPGQRFREYYKDLPWMTRDESDNTEA